MRANLPADVVRILPWEKVTNGATAAPPDGMPGFINVLVQLGQLFYKGLVALVTFLVNLAEAIWDWGMRVWGAVSQAIAGAVQAAVETLQSFLEWVANFAVAIVKGILDVLIRPVADAIAGWGRSISDSISGCVTNPSCTASALAWTLGGIILGGTLFIALLAMVGGIAIIETATKPILGIAVEVVSIVVDIVVGLTVGALIALLIPAAYSGSQTLSDIIPAALNGAIAAAFGAIEFSIALGAYLATQTRTLESLSFIAPVSLAVSIAGLLVLTAKTLATQETKEFAARRIIFDVIEIALVGYALLELEIPGPIKRWYKILWKADQAFGIIAIVAGFTELVRDVQLALE